MQYSVLLYFTVLTSFSSVLPLLHITHSEINEFDSEESKRLPDRFPASISQIRTGNNPSVDTTSV